MKTPFNKIPLGITDDQVELGTHLVHFWQTQDEFECGVRFLEIGMADKSQYCVLFGHDEANQRVLDILRGKGHDVDRAIREERLVSLRRESSAAATLERIETAFSSAVRRGVTVIRYLGNLGMGQAPLPGRGADEVIELEKGATLLGLRYPCVIVCMYDVNTVSGALLLNGGFGTHSHAVSQQGLRPNSYCPSDQNARPVFAKRDG